MLMGIQDSRMQDRRSSDMGGGVCKKLTKSRDEGRGRYELILRTRLRMGVGREVGRGGGECCRGWVDNWRDSD